MHISFHRCFRIADGVLSMETDPTSSEEDNELGLRTTTIGNEDSTANISTAVLLCSETCDLEGVPTKVGCVVQIGTIVQIVAFDPNYE